MKEKPMEEKVKLTTKEKALVAAVFGKLQEQRAKAKKIVHLIECGGLDKSLRFEEIVKGLRALCANQKIKDIGIEYKGFGVVDFRFLYHETAE
jgi:hypothetical protein